MGCEGWEGLTVDGKFPLLEWLRGSTARCVYLTIRQGTLGANIKVIAAGEADGDEYLAKWEAAKSLSHPFLVQMMETGRSAINGKDVVYVVTEKAEAFLSGIIPRKALEADAVKTILEPVADALSFVHDKGLVHGGVKPSNIDQIGEQWKLSSDEIAGAGARLTREPDTYDAPEVAVGGELTAAADAWSLGIITIEAFAQKTPMWDREAKGDLGVPDFIPDPFREIARGCLRWEPGQRISIAEVKALLAQYTPSPSTGTNAAEPSEVRLPAATAAVGPLFEGIAARDWQQEKPRPAHADSFREEPPELAPRSRMFGNLEEEEEPRSAGWLIFFGIVALVVIAAVLAVRGYWSEFWRPAESQNAPQQSQPAPQAQTPQAEGGSTPTSPATGQSGAQSQPPQESQGAATSGTASQSQQAPSTPSAQPQTQPAPAEQAPAAHSSTAENPPAAAPKKREREPAQEAPRVANGKGAVEKRVLPEVAPGARDSMRRPMQVEVRVFVNADGTVENAEYLTQGPGNYFARIARQAVESWKFKPPVTDGHPRESVWIVMFRFERRNVDAIATETR